MVYFKVNRVLAKVILLAEMKDKSAIGCTMNCDKQLISLDHLDICMGVIRRKIEELEKLLADQKDVREAEKASEPAKHKKGEKQTKEQMDENMRKMRLQAKLLTIDKLSDQKVKEAEKMLAELNEFKDKTAPEIGRQAEMLMTQDHICNIAIKNGLIIPYVFFVIFA